MYKGHSVDGYDKVTMNIQETSRFHERRYQRPAWVKKVYMGSFFNHNTQLEDHVIIYQDGNGNEFEESLGKLVPLKEYSSYTLNRDWSNVHQYVAHGVE